MFINYIKIFISINFLNLVYAIEWNENCNLSDGQHGVLRLKENCKHFNSTNENSGICNGYSLCEDLVCCPLENLTRDLKTCYSLDDPTVVMHERLRSYEECRTKGDNVDGVYTHFDDCPQYNNVTSDKVQKACDYEFCEDWVCCPLKNWEKRPRKIYADQIYRHTEVIGESCVVESSGKKGTCRADQQCSSYKWNDQTATICGYESCTRIVCCENPEIEKMEKSEKNCVKYTKTAFDRTRKLKALSKTNDDANCSGTSSIAAYQVQPKEYAHAAALGYKNENNTITWICNGAILSENFILTSKQCFDSNLTVARLGTLGDVNSDYFSEGGCPENFGIDEMIAHNESDIGLIKLERNIEFNTLMRPACLLHDSTVNNFSQILTYLKKDSLNLESLYKLSLDVKNFDEFEINGTVYFNRDTKTLAELLTSGDPVHDDRKAGYLMSNIIGIISSVNSDTDVLITRISPFIDWIEKIVWT